MREKKGGSEKKREGSEKKRGERQIFDRTISVHKMWTLIVDYQRRLWKSTLIILYTYSFFLFFFYFFVRV
jgi:hypothetical protein